jgi:hypothetical protein
MAFLAGLHFFLAIPGVVTGRAFGKAQVGMSLVMESHSTGLGFEGERFLALGYLCREGSPCNGNKEYGDNDVLKFHCIFLKSLHLSLVERLICARTWAGSCFVDRQDRRM